MPQPPRALALGCLLLSAAMSLVPAVAKAAEAEREPAAGLGAALPRFELNDYRGRAYASDDFADSQILVLAVLGTECPLAKLYAPRLQALDDTYRPRGVAIVGVDANVHDSMSEIASYARRHELSFPILKDVGNRLADKLGAQRTPEVFVFDAQRRLRYRGRIDDQYGVGTKRDGPQRRDLAEAIEAVLGGHEVEVPRTEAVGCHIGRVKSPATDADVTYAGHVAAIFNRRCVECHREGQIAPFALTEYEEAAGWAEMIGEVVREQRMPPWHADPAHGKFANDRLLSDEEKQLIYRWVELGAPQGDPALTPAAPQFVSGWQLPREPDLELHVTDEPFEVQAEGEIKYQWFTVDPGFTEDKWLAGAEIVPGNRAVVHHVLAFAARPGDRRRGEGSGGYLVGYVPGLRAGMFPPGMAKRIPAGSQLVFQVHYTPVGSVQHDRSKIGLIFADPKEVTHEIRTMSAANHRFVIPAHDDNYRVEATSQRAADELLLLSLMPHMHLRGKSFVYEAQYADGSSEVLLNVPRYDFNWQTAYRLTEPKTLPAGTRMHAVAHYDNSEENLANPDPSSEVRWGDQTWEEMMIGYFDIAIPVEQAAASEMSPETETAIGRLLAARGDAPARAQRLIAILDRDRNGQLDRDEVGPRLVSAFDRVDRDADETVSLEELTKALSR